MDPVPDSHTGIGHTRWATHGAPAVHNAHPHFSHGTKATESTPRIALVHNGIIENHDELRQSLQAKGYQFDSQTDTEVMVHLIDSLYAGDLLAAVMQAVKQFHGAFAIAVMARDEPHRVVGARAGLPLVLGIGQGELFLASDAMALAREIAVRSPDAVRGAKRLLNLQANDGAAAQFAQEREVIGRLIGHANQAEAVMSHFEKRPPNFQSASLF